MDFSGTDIRKPLWILHVAYHGGAYHGWQRQKADSNTVQETLETILQRITGETDLCLTGAGRTDRGVHALDMLASFRSGTEIPAEIFLEKLSRQSPHSLRILSLERQPDVVKGNAHTMALGKAYIYVIHTGPHALFLKDLTWSWPEESLNFQNVMKILSMLRGRHDFQMFVGKKKTSPAGASSVRTLYRAEWISRGPVHLLYISGDGFLYKMVRKIAGCCHEAACGRLTPEMFRSMLADPEAAGKLCETAAPACGLYLKKVFVKENEWQRDMPGEIPFFL